MEAMEPVGEEHKLLEDIKPDTVSITIIQVIAFYSQTTPFGIISPITFG